MARAVRNPCQCGGSGAGSFSPSIRPMIRSDAGGDAAGEIAALEFRRDVLVDDALGGDVGQRAFEAIADLDAQMPVVLGDDQQRAVVDLLAADLPGLRDPDRELLDGLGLASSARSGPRSGCPCGFRDPSAFGQRGDVAARERAGLVDHAARERRHRDISRRPRIAQHIRSARRTARAAFIADQIAQSTVYFAGAAGVGLKSTFGAVEISFSFSTEKFGFSL